jgi:hypothetical protein
MPDNSVQGSADTRYLFLESALKSQASGFDRRSKENHRWVFWFRCMAIGSGFLATVLLGLDLANAPIAPQLVKNAALVFTSFATAVTAFEAYFNPRDLWVRYTLTSGRLKGLLARLEYRRCRGDLVPEETDRIFEEMQEILAETNADWAKARDTARSRTDPPSSPTGTPPTAPAGVSPSSGRQPPSGAGSSGSGTGSHG